MGGKIVIDGNSVYEIDEACMIKKEKEKRTDFQNQVKKSECARHRNESLPAGHSDTYSIKKSESF